MVKSFEIPKQLVWEAYLKVKANGGAGGVDEQSIEEFEEDLKGNLYKIWNRLSSGSYFPPPVRGVPIPKKSGGIRMLGVPTVSDRIAQMVVKLVLEPMLEPHFHANSYGYRPNKSAHDAIEVTRHRCWRYDWVVEFDIRGLFDNIDHELLLRALRKHCSCEWVILYIERWLKAPLQDEHGHVVERTKGTPQGGVVSPLLANLFLHYAVDVWISRHFPTVPFCRYADDGLLHCKSRQQAEEVLRAVEKRFQECGLEIHPGKSKIVYCKDVNRREDYANISFDFLGFTFRPRSSKDKYGRRYVNFSPAVSKAAKKAMRQAIRSWHLQLKNDRTLEDLSRMFDPVLRGWANYYGKFYKSEMVSIWYHTNMYLVRWVMRKYKRYARHRRRANEHLNRIARVNPGLFAQWKLGIYPAAG
ncbi:MAG: group II intron reverse transcriptase/maturase [Acidobacteria bacterium]|nr:group II intron reverse transcriptase/maturase [Acidobacteriota bacterium]MBI3658175.1 group II intron reverse transcriptase/maturase [Acidobacteriota bacterium]